MKATSGDVNVRGGGGPEGPVLKGVRGLELIGRFVRGTCQRSGSPGRNGGQKKKISL